VQKEMDANAKVPPVQPVTEPLQPPAKPDSTPSQDPQPVVTSPDTPAYVADPADYRLVVDRDPISGTFVYRTVDRMTGETVAQFPSEEIVAFRDSADYMTGTVVKAKV
jgi:flagellar protein FlaG